MLMPWKGGVRWQLSIVEVENSVIFFYFGVKDDEGIITLYYAFFYI